jgi:hypothetical protein
MQTYVQKNNTKTIVIPAKAGIQRRASARHKSQTRYRSAISDIIESFARYCSRWIAAFARMTAVLIVCEET